MPSYAKFDVWQNTAGVNYNSILQVQSTVLTNTFSTTTLISSGGAAVTGLSVNITPKYSTSKIFVMGHANFGCNTSSTQIYFRLRRNNTEIGNGISVGSRPGVLGRTYPSSNAVSLTTPFMFLDSPDTTTLLTYQLYLGTESANVVSVNQTFTDSDAINGARASSTITVMEIAQ